jgi:DNA-binding PadR family transcriptional regulator
MRQEVVLAKESHGYELRAQLDRALGPLAEGTNDGQVYVTLTRLETGGLVERDDAPSERLDREVYRSRPPARSG